ncbi:hypothetical protein [Staphylospora marina]|uniref:hypothetical protein n=1 Tax=Staphylospora marina TaxID=2490858 RepID=UPI000F5C1204|nr:hypothetical protein [Staphylospora marina]
MNRILLGRFFPFCIHPDDGKDLADQLLPLLWRLHRHGEQEDGVKIEIDFSEAYLFTLDFFENAFGRVLDVTTREMFERTVELHGLPPTGRAMLEHVLDKAEKAERRPLSFQKQEEEKEKWCGELLPFDPSRPRKGSVRRRRKQTGHQEPRKVWFMSHTRRLYLEVPRGEEVFQAGKRLNDLGIPASRISSGLPLDQFPEEILGGSIIRDVDEFIEAHLAPEQGSNREETM